MANKQIIVLQFKRVSSAIYQYANIFNLFKYMQPDPTKNTYLLSQHLPQQTKNNDNGLYYYTAHTYK